MAHRCYLPDWTPATGSLAIDGDEAHHLTRVLRSKPGDEVEVLNGAGGVGRGTIASVDRRHLVLAITEQLETPPPSKQFTLIQATPKGKRQELVLQKAVELGVHRIVFVQTRNVIARVKPPEAEDKIHRWRQVLVAGLKQSGNPWLPRMELAFDWQAVLDQAIAEQDAVFLADLSPGAEPLRDVLPRHRAASRLACCIGPEGDFTPEETQAAHSAGCLPVNLGSRVLRTETAALYLMSVFAYEFLN